MSKRKVVSTSRATHDLKDLFKKKQTTQDELTRRAQVLHAALTGGDICAASLGWHETGPGGPSRDGRQLRYDDLSEDPVNDTPVGKTPEEEHRRVQEVNGCKTLLFEVVRRAAHDWVLYRSSRRQSQRRLAMHAYRWLFQEDTDHPDWVRRAQDDKQITSFLSICLVLDLDPDKVRQSIRQLTPRSVLSGRPPEYRSTHVNAE